MIDKNEVNITDCDNKILINRGLKVEDLEAVKPLYGDSCTGCVLNESSCESTCQYFDRDDNKTVIFQVKDKKDIIDTKYRGKFISLLSKNNWEYVTRTGSKPKKPDAVTIISKDTATNKWMCIIEKRIPIQEHSQSDGYILSFVSGLVDNNDSVKTTAIREFKEEVGYKLQVLNEYILTYTSSGLTDESIVTVYGCFDSTSECEQELQESEDITPILIKDLDELYKIADENGYNISDKVSQHFITLSLMK